MQVAFNTLFLTMPRHFFLLVFLTSSLPSVAQQRIPVFATKEDSAAYEQINLKLADAMRNPRYTFRIDSLGKASALLREKAIRFRTVYRSSPGFTRYGRFPADLKTVTKVSLADFKGTTLPDSLFLLTNLTELELVNTRIRKLPSKLTELKVLKRLSLVNNRPSGRLRIGKNDHLQALAIHDDELDRRPRNYRKLTSLQSLDLSRCNLEKFPVLRGSSKLKRLVLTDNHLTLDDLRKGLPELEELVLTSNAIRKVPTAIWAFPKLKKLNLNANQVESIPASIMQLQQLEQLSLYKNNLRTLPPEVYELRNLRVVDLYYNQLEELTPAVRQLANLEILYAANNRLFTVPEELGELKNLRELYLHHNRLSNLPASLRGLDSLKILRVNDNLLVEFPAPVLSLKALENLDIASNQLTEIPEALFTMPQLQILSLKGNPLEPKAKASALQWARALMQRRPVMIHLEGILEPETK